MNNSYRRRDRSATDGARVGYAKPAHNAALMEHVF